jgi:hypothetical protein
MTFASAAKLALAADTASITVMEIIDNAIMLVIPGAMDAGLASPLFWGSLAFSLAVAAVAAFPVNRWLISRGKGRRSSMRIMWVTRDITERARRVDAITMVVCRSGYERPANTPHGGTRAAARAQSNWRTISNDA